MDLDSICSIGCVFMCVLNFVLFFNPLIKSHGVLLDMKFWGI